jgi:hypothetical protein
MVLRSSSSSRLWRIPRRAALAATVLCHQIIFWRNRTVEDEDDDEYEENSSTSGLGYIRRTLLARPGQGILNDTDDHHQPEDPHGYKGPPALTPIERLGEITRFLLAPIQEGNGQ